VEHIPSGKPGTWEHGAAEVFLLQRRVGLTFFEDEPLFS